MKKKRNILMILALVLALSVTLVACGDSADEPATEDNGGDEATGAEVMGLTEAFAEGPVLLTSVGQSADVEMVKSLMDNGGIDHEIEKLATSEDLGDANTLVLAIGGSSKGLGAAGIDADDELARVEELIDAAKENDVDIIAMHIGGSGRRGELSDKFIEPAANRADYIIVVEDGNKDGIFDDIASKNDIPMETVGSIGDALEPLEKAFK